MDKTYIKSKLDRKICMFDNDSFFIQRLSGGPYQKHNLVRARQLVPNARTILDIGMNLGMNTWEYATWAEKVVGFEPTPHTYDMAVENILMNQQQYTLGKGWYKNPYNVYASLELTAQVETHNIALGALDCDPEVLLSSHTSVGHNHITTVADIKSIAVPQKALDTFSYECVDFIKIDVEGYEMAVLMGATETITTNRPVVQIEIDAHHLKRFSYTPQDVIDWFAALGYVSTDSSGRNYGTQWEHLDKNMDRFMIPSEKTDLYSENVFNTLFDL